MPFNTSKFEVLRFGRNLDLKNCTNHLTPEAKDLIQAKEVLWDLGVMVNDLATFKDHVDKVCAKVNQNAGWILRTLNFREKKKWFMKLMWKTLFQGHIDYCSQLYQPVKTGNLRRIKELQNSYTKKIPDKASLHHGCFHSYVCILF